MSTATNQPTKIPYIPASVAGPNRNAYMAMYAILSTWGLQSLAPELYGFIQQGFTDPNVLEYFLTTTDAYKERFAGNVIRQKNNLPVLSERDYLSTETAYKALFRAAGLPAGFYDQPSDFAQMIGNDISPQEAQYRINTAASFLHDTDPAYRNALQAYHGIDSSHLLAYYLDPAKSLDLLQRQSSEAFLGGAATRQGLQLPDVAQLDKFITGGYDASHAQQDMATVAEITPELQGLGQIYKSPYDQSTAIDEVIGGLASAKRKRESLTQNEKDTFSGVSGAGKDTLAVSSTGSY